MGKLTKSQSKLHREACQLLQKDTLTLNEIDFVYRNWHEGGVADQTALGAFFTPVELASDLTIEAQGDTIIDLCAGIGVLSYASYHFGYGRGGCPARKIVCVEKNPAFVEIGRKLLPQATWICADIFNLHLKDLGHFDYAIGNPPFGKVPRTGKAPRYTGSHFEYHVLDIASEIADHGAFIVSQGISPFRLSGARHYDRKEPLAYTAFENQTRIVLEAGCGIDTTVHKDDWKQPVPTTEVVCADFMEARDQRKPKPLSIEIEPLAANPVQGELFG